MRRLAILLFTALVGVSGCSGIPDSSTPQAVKSLQIQPEVPAVEAPPPGADPRLIVQGFLDANNAGDPHHAAARQFLTPEAKNRWSDSTMTVLDDPRVGNVDSSNQVVVQGHKIGGVAASGVYTASLSGDGTGRGGQNVPLTFGMKRVNGQWRINRLQNGLVIGYAQFQQYRPRIVYFYDLAERHLVPDPRYSQLTDPGALATWLFTQLIDGPRDLLQNAVTTELPAQTDPKRVAVDVGKSPAEISIPGAAGLDVGTRNRLAAQIAPTLAQVAGGELMQIMDGGRPVYIPAVRRASFTATDFADQVASVPSAPGLYYVSGGAVFDQDGRRLPGPVGNGNYGLRSVALADRGGAQGLLVAGVRGSPATLDIGTARRGLIATTVRGQLSRPAWVPAEREAWVGDGPLLYRVGPSGVAQVIQVTSASGPASGRVAAVRLSPEGSRVALVLVTPDGGSQLWLGAVVRASSGKVRVDSLTPISPRGITVTDVAWNTELKLFAIGRDASSLDPGIYEVQSDGSLWNPKGIGNLPQGPDSITVTENVVASVSTGPTVWKQRAGSWVGLHGDETQGSKPVYVE